MKPQMFDIWGLLYFQMILLTLQPLIPAINISY